MNYTSTSPALAKAERGTHYKLARQMGDTYEVMDAIMTGRKGLTISNGIG
jgi:hypothetical protein